MRAPDHNLQPQNAARSSLAQPCLRARPGATSAEFIQVFGYGGAGSLAVSDLAARRPQTAQGVRDLVRFQTKACPGLDPSGFGFAQGRTPKQTQRPPPCDER